MAGKFGTWLNGKGANVISGIAGAASKIGAAAQGLNEGQTVVNQGLHGVMQSLGPVGNLVSGALGSFDAIGGMFGAKVDILDSATAKRAGVSGANTASSILSSIPGMGTISGLFASKTIKSNKSAEIDQLASAYGGSVGDINAAQKMGGKKMLFGKGKANKFIRKQNRINKLLTDISLDAKLAKSNTAAETYISQNQNTYSGYTPQLFLSKHGMKIPELEEVRNLIKFWNAEKRDVSKFKNGGKIEDKNIIPEGALHARKHSIEEENPELKDNITKKGIPVITQSNDGIVQVAEIERDEWTLRREATDKLEDLYKQYQKNPSDDIAIEAGKLICYELLKNTTDNTGLIKSIKQ